MNLAYDLKQKNPELKRNVKFDEDECSLFMDVQVKGGGPWKRIGADQASKLKKKKRGLERFEIEELKDLMGSSDAEESE